MNLVTDLQWRYATKKFDASKTVAATDIETLQKAVNLTATSYGLQPFRVLLVTDPALKAKLRPAAYNQSQITDASHLFIFCYKTDISDAYVDDYMQRIAHTRGIAVENLKGFGDTIKGSVASRPAADVAAWNKHQAYIALGTLMAAAAEMKIDTCPMEGFDPAQFDEILELDKLGLKSAVIAAVGYRSAEDGLAQAAKVRLALADLFITR